jgi:hypothetical protein
MIFCWMILHQVVNNVACNKESEGSQKVLHAKRI